MKLLLVLTVPILLVASTRDFRGGNIIEPENIALEQIEETIVKNLNFNRKKRRRETITRDLRLDSVLSYAMEKRPNKSLYNLKRYVKRHFYETARPLGYKNSWFKILYSKFRVMKTSGRKHFYDKKSAKFFFGKRKQYKDSLTISDTVPRYTYNEFSSMLLRYVKPGVNRRWMGVGEVNKIGIKARVSKPLESGKSPEVEIIMILSGTVMPKEF